MDDQDFTKAGGSSAPVAYERKRYELWWENALSAVRGHSIVSWAQRVVSAYVATHDEQFDLAARDRLQRAAMECALYADGRFVGDWSPPTCVEMARKSVSELAEVASSNHQCVDERRRILQAELAKLRNPNERFLARMPLIKLGEAMLARLG